MKKYYKVEITRSQKFVVDIQAENEEQAKEKMWKEFDGIENSGTLHFYEQDDEETEISAVYDVTGTDDAPQVCEVCGKDETTEHDDGKLYCDEHYK